MLEWPAVAKCSWQTTRHRRRSVIRQFSSWRTRHFWVAFVLLPIPTHASGPTAPALADTTAAAASRWQLVLDFSWIDPSGAGISTNASGPIVGTNFDTGVGAGVRAEYNFSARFGVEFGILGTVNLDVSIGTPGPAFGRNIRVSSFAPVTLGLNVHLTPDRSVDLYAGPLLALSNYGNVDVSTGMGAASTSVSIDRDVGYGAILGLDVPLGDHGWLVQANLRYIATEIKSSGGVSSFSREFNPVIFSVGLGYRF
jgi:outer membrane protein W